MLQETIEALDMVLRRIAEGFRNQDWFVVGVEIMVVVVGIFLALQVDDWNEQRKMAKLEEEYLIRLLLDAEKNSEELAGRVAWHYEMGDNLEEVVRYLLSDVEDDEWRAKVNALRVGRGVVPSPNLRRSTFREMETSGNLIIVQNDQLKDALLELEATHNRSAEQLDYFRNWIVAVSAAVDPTGKREVFRLGADGNVERAPVDFYLLRGDEVQIDFLAQGIAMQNAFGSFREVELKATNHIKRVLQCELQKPECTEEAQ